MEATWALANIASGTTSQIQSIVDKGGIYYFVQLLKCDRMEIVEQVYHCIKPTIIKLLLRRSGRLQTLRVILLNTGI